MNDFLAEDQRNVEMAVYVRRAKTGKLEGVVAEEQLENYGWGTDPLGAIERYREALGIPQEVEISVHTDEASHYPIHRFHLTIDAYMDTTRHHKVLREMGQYLIDAANGLHREDVPFTGEGLRLNDEGEVT